MPYNHPERKYIPGPDSCEDVEEYQVGGYHPVHINDSFCDDRYVVVHKLGSGGLGTVWLARETRENRLVALKILRADKPKDCDELKIYQHLATGRSIENHDLSIPPLLDNFEILGPNGTHVCLVLPFLGPSICSLRAYAAPRKIKPDVARKVAFEVAQAVSTLHKTGVIIGDLSTANILFRLKNLDSASTNHIYGLFGHPVRCPVKPWELRETNWWEENANDGFQGSDSTNPNPVPDIIDDPSHAPQYVYEPINFAEINSDTLEPRIAIIDFGESTLLSQLDKGNQVGDFGVNFSYSAPEVLFDQLRSTASDVWALACCLFEIRSGSVLFCQEFGGIRVVLDEIFHAIGPIPDVWKAKLPDGLKRDPPPRKRSLKDRVQYIGQWPKWCYWTPEKRREALLDKDPYYGQWGNRAPIEEEIHRGSNPPNPLSEEECDDFIDLLSKMLKYEPSARITMKEVIEHPWFHKTYVDEWDDSGPWLQEYDPGNHDWGFYVEDAAP